MSLRVWAPHARQVDLIIGDERIPMLAASDGWWASRGEAPAPGLDYGYSLDGGARLPDPRGLRLRHGVHGPSQQVDHASFRWTDQGWRSPGTDSAIIYELHVGTFSPAGTFDGVTDRLDHLVDLGISHVELMPVHAFPGRHGWGYDVAGFYAVHEPYGGPDGLKRLVDACHARGLAVLLDVVYNHMGPEGSYLGSFGPYLTDRFRTPWGGAMNLGEAGADVVRGFIIDNALMWLRDYHLDGLRIDAVHAFIDLTATHLLEELAVAVERSSAELGRHALLVAESDLNDPRLLHGRDVGGYGLDAQWSDDFHHALHTTLTPQRDGYYEDFDGFEDLVTALREGWVYRGQRSAHRGRRHGRDPVDFAQRRLVSFVQNHDQVGNRAQGDRFHALAGLDGLRVAAALNLLGPFTPLVFQGEEWAASSPFLYFTDFGDRELGEAVREGRRREFAPFGWRPEDIPDPQAEQTFRASCLEWAELDRSPHAELLAWYRRIMAIRRTLLSPTDPTPAIEADMSTRILSMHWRDWSVSANLAKDGLARHVPGVRPILLAGTAGVALDGDDLLLPPLSAAVLGEATTSRRLEVGTMPAALREGAATIKDGGVAIKDGTT